MWAACGQLGSKPTVRERSVSLRTQLTIAFLLLTLIPSAIFSLTALQKIIAANELWESAGMNVFLESSLSTATRSLERLEYDLEHAASRCWRDGRKRYPSSPTSRASDST